MRAAAWWALRKLTALAAAGWLPSPPGVYVGRPAGVSGLARARPSDAKKTFITALLHGIIRARQKNLDARESTSEFQNLSYHIAGPSGSKLYYC